MARNSAVVHDGLRGTDAGPRVGGPRGNPDGGIMERAASAAARAAERLNLKPGERLFRSAVLQLRILLVSTKDAYDVVSGRIVAGDNLVAQFKPGADGIFGELRTADKKVIELLEKHPQYGLGLLFWDEVEMRHATVKAQTEAMVEQVRSNPALQEALGELFRKDFVLPPKKGEGGQQSSEPPANP